MAVDRSIVRNAGIPINYSDPLNQLGDSIKKEKVFDQTTKLNDQKIAMNEQQMATDKYNSLDARQKSRLESSLYGSAQLNGFLENNDIDGAKSFLQERKQNLSQRIADGEDIDTAETDGALKMLENGQVEQLKNVTKQSINFGKLTGIFKDTGKGGATGELVDRYVQSENDRRKTTGEKPIDFAQGLSDIQLGKSGGGAKVTWSDDAIDAAARGLLGGVPLTQVAPGLGAKNANRDAIMNRAVELNPDFDIAKAKSGFAGQQAESKTTGNIGGRIEFAANSLDESIPVLRDAIKNVDLSKFTDLNALENYYKTHTSDTNLSALRTALQATENDYSALIARNGVPTDATRATARALINENMGKGSMEGFISQVEKESAAQRRAKQNTTGRAPATGAAATPNSPAAGNGFQRTHSGVGYRKVQ